jgi:hypothetical protein
VQTLSFSAPGPSIPLPRPTEMAPVISEPSALSEGDYESLSQENESGNSANSISGSRERESSQESYNGRGGGQGYQQGYQQGQGSVNVQTSSQPVLVVPLNMSSQQGGQASAQYLNSAAPGAPATFAVDTSTITNPSSSRSQSNSRSASPGPSRNNAQKVSVTKTGGGGEGAPTPANTRVTVVKHN